MGMVRKIFLQKNFSNHPHHNFSLEKKEDETSQLEEKRMLLR